jgi:hypothetical protein
MSDCDFPVHYAPKDGLYSSMDSAEKPPLGFCTFLQLRPFADQPEFVASINFPFHHFPWFNINGSGEREWQVHIALREALFASDALNLCRVFHKF